MVYWPHSTRSRFVRTRNCYHGNHLHCPPSAMPACSQTAICPCLDLISRASSCHMYFMVSDKQRLCARRDHLSRSTMNFAGPALMTLILLDSPKIQNFKLQTFGQVNNYRWISFKSTTMTQTVRLTNSSIGYKLNPSLLHLNRLVPSPVIRFNQFTAFFTVRRSGKEESAPLNLIWSLQLY